MPSLFLASSGFYASRVESELQMTSRSKKGQSRSSKTSRDLSPEDVARREEKMKGANRKKGR